MQDLLFQFGNFPDFSELEIKKRTGEIPQKKINNFAFFSKEKINQVFDKNNIINDKNNLQNFLNTLGGTIKIAQIFSQNNFSQLENKITTFLAKKFSSKGKNKFSLSIFPLTLQKKLLKKLLINVKKNLRKQNFSVRFVNKDFQNQSSNVFLQEKNLIEIIILQYKNDFFLAETLAVQDVKKFSQRDYLKPSRDMKIGMTPVKLALMMLNFACDRVGNLPKSIWDPFCGTGTILTEALTLGINQLYGSDIAEENLQKAKQNLDFFQKKLTSSHQSIFNKLFTFDARKILTQKINTKAIVSETFLGPIFSHPLDKSEAEKVAFKIKQILDKFFKNLSKNFSGQTIVLAIPFWRMKNQQFFLLSIQKLIPSNWSLENKNLFFIRKNQNVGRQILILKLN